MFWGILEIMQIILQKEKRQGVVAKVNIWREGQTEIGFGSGRDGHGQQAKDRTTARR